MAEQNSPARKRAMKLKAKPKKKATPSLRAYERAGENASFKRTASPGKAARAALGKAASVRKKAIIPKGTMQNRKSLGPVAPGKPSISTNGARTSLGPISTAQEVRLNKPGSPASPNVPPPTHASNGPGVKKPLNVGGQSNGPGVKKPLNVGGQESNGQGQRLAPGSKARKIKPLVKPGRQSMSRF